MPLFGEDPKDLLIAQLANERDYLRAKVDELQREVLARDNAGAYRLLHRETPEEAGPPPPPSPMQLRNAEPVKPQQTMGEIKASWDDKASWGES